jgi:Holliday junction resolvase RusA-like endonuclease
MVNRKTGTVVTPQKATVLVYRADIQRIWGEPQPLVGPITIDVEFRFQRPKAHFNKTGLKPSAPKPMTQSPDLDKLVRSVLDALTFYAYVDDKQVTRVNATKTWWHQSETHIVVSEKE